jgi:hypothetical protein
MPPTVRVVLTQRGGVPRASCLNASASHLASRASTYVARLHLLRPPSRLRLALHLRLTSPRRVSRLRLLAFRLAFRPPPSPASHFHLPRLPPRLPASASRLRLPASAFPPPASRVRFRRPPPASRFPPPFSATHLPPSSLASRLPPLASRRPPLASRRPPPTFISHVRLPVSISRLRLRLWLVACVWGLTCGGACVRGRVRAGAGACQWGV